MERNKTFREFCVRAVILLIIIFGVDRLVGQLFVVMKDLGLEYNPYHQWTKTAYTLEKCDADCIIIGSSKAEHSYVVEILADSLGMNIYDGGQGGCFFLYQNCIVNMLLDRRKPKNIIWDIQPECIPEDSKMKEYQNIRYLSPYYDSSPWAKAFMNSEDNKTSLKMQCRMFRYNSKLMQYVMPIVIGKDRNDGGYKSLPNSGYIYPAMNSNSLGEENRQIAFDEYKLSVYEATLRRCKENKVNLLIFVSPSFSNHNFVYRQAVLKLEEITQNKGYKFVDYSANNSFLRDSTLFKDVSHLNDKGARLFTQMAIKDILKNKE